MPTSFLISRSNMETFITIVVLALSVGFVSSVLYNFINRKRIVKEEASPVSKCACGGNCPCGTKKLASKEVQPLLGVVIPKLQKDAVAIKSKKKAVK